MADSIVLKSVKDALGITGDYQDATLTVYITEVKEYMESAGVSKDQLDGVGSAGVIARGVADLWNYGSGTGKLSDYFLQRVSQLALRKEANDGV